MLDYVTALTTQFVLSVTLNVIPLTLKKIN